MKQKLLILTVFLLAIALLSQRCGDSNCLKGNHDLTSENRSISPFTAVTSEGHFEVNIEYGQTHEITVEAESNLLSYVTTRVNGSTLLIKTRDNRCFREHYPIVITVKTPFIDKIKLTGSGEIHCDSINASSADLRLTGSGEIYTGVWANYLEADISGSGEIYLWGDVSESELEISGSGDFKAYDLMQDTCFADISGSGSMYLWVTDLLDVKITGSGSVHYIGNPTVNTYITGSGKVVHH